MAIQICAVKYLGGSFVLNPKGSHGLHDHHTTSCISVNVLCTSHSCPHKDWNWQTRHVEMEWNSQPLCCETVREHISSKCTVWAVSFRASHLIVATFFSWNLCKAYFCTHRSKNRQGCPLVQGFLTPFVIEFFSFGLFTHMVSIFIEFVCFNCRFFQQRHFG